MRLLRSWPKVVPPGRPHVVDNLDRLVIENYNYRPLADVDDDVLLLEWDIAIGQEHLERFIDRCRAEPDRVRCAPYRIYGVSCVVPEHWHRFTANHGKVWSPRRFKAPPPGDPLRSGFVYVDEGEPFCHLFGFGATYLPRTLVRRFTAFWPGRWTDATFSGWHYHHAGVDREVPVDWDTIVTHLHYADPELPAAPTPAPVSLTIEQILDKGRALKQESDLVTIYKMVEHASGPMAFLLATGAGAETMRGAGVSDDLGAVLDVLIGLAEDVRKRAADLTVDFERSYHAALEAIVEERQRRRAQA